jgi:hypothetical protein
MNDLLVVIEKLLSGAAVDDALGRCVFTLVWD